MKMKKVLLGAFLGIFTFAGIAVMPSITLAQENGGSDGKPAESETYGGLSGQGGFGYDGNTSYNPDVAGNGTFQGNNLIKTIQTAINWVLGMLSFIALLLCLWGGFKMMTSGGDQKKYQDGLNILKWAAIGLAVIALSWLIVSLIFWVINGSIKTSTKTQ